MALVAGVQAPAARIMGHAGAFIDAGEKNARGKIKALEDAGVVTTNHPSKFGDGMKRLLFGVETNKISVSATNAHCL